MKHILDAGHADRFVIYLNDHRGLVAAESDLVRRSHTSNSENDGDSDLVVLLADIIAQNLDDGRRLDVLLAARGGRSNPFKTAAARLGERLGRLKPNGQLRGYSPLSRVIEIESLIASTSVRHAMWVCVAATSRGDDADDGRRRAEVAADQRQRLEQHLAPAASRAFEGS